MREGRLLIRKNSTTSYSAATVIANPSARGRGKPVTARRIREGLQGRAESLRFVRTRGKDDAASLAHEAVVAGSELIVVVGGDGTVNQVVNGIIEGGKRSSGACVLGIIPEGASCSLARELGIPRGLASLGTIVEGSVKPIDLLFLKWETRQGERKERLAVTVANFGLGGAVVGTMGRRMKRLGGFLAYGVGAIVQLLRYRSNRMIVEVDGRTVAQARLLCTIVANTQWEGGGMHVAPEARSDDGTLDVVVVEDLPTVSRLRYFPKVYAGKHIGVPAVRCVKGRRVVVRSIPPLAGLPFEYDGEWAECRECSVEVLPKALRVLVPGRQAGGDA